MCRGIFLDRDGVLNEERGTYTYLKEDFILLPGVGQAIKQLHNAGFLLVVITNQGGIGRGLYSRKHVEACYDYMQQCFGGLLTGMLYSPYHPEQTASLSRKPSPYLFERAMALYDIGTADSWAVGDQERDITAARAAGLRNVAIGTAPLPCADFHASSLLDATERIILPQSRQKADT